MARVSMFYINRKGDGILTEREYYYIIYFRLKHKDDSELQ